MLFFDTIIHAHIHFDPVQPLPPTISTQSHHHLPMLSTSCLFFFSFNELLFTLCAVHIFLGVGLSTGTWVTYQEPHL